MPDTTMSSLTEVFLFESSQLLERLEEIVLSGEKAGSITKDGIDEIFRIMHTIKGSSAMMEYDAVSKLAHAVEDLFGVLRESKGTIEATAEVYDYVLQASDFIKGEIAKISTGLPSDGNSAKLAESIRTFAKGMKAGPPKATAAAPKAAEPAPADANKRALVPGETRYHAHVQFDENCQMENIRAFGLVHSMRDLCVDISHTPEDLLDDESTAERIAKEGFDLCFTSTSDSSVFERVFDQTMFLHSFTLETGEAAQDKAAPAAQTQTEAPQPQAEAAQSEPRAEVAQDDAQDKRDQLLKTVKQSQISVNISKLDSLLDLVGEIVISEAMVTRNPDLNGLELENFNKSARHLRKLTGELQDLVMSVRMIPVANTFHKMTRIVRDMSKKLEKEADLMIEGEDTEVDKNVIDTLSDPLMHLIRNAMDHGIESPAERAAAGKPPEGRVTLEAVNTGGDVIIRVTDDGRGLNRDKIVKKARDKGLLTKPESTLTERDIFNLVLLPGFSTNESVSEFSGRGVGMDVVRRNIEKVGGTVSIESTLGQGTTVTIRIPMTLAIIDGMLFSVGGTVFTAPTVAIKEAFLAAGQKVTRDPEGHELVLLRGRVLPVLRLNEAYHIDNAVTDFGKGVMILIESDDRAVCLFADKLVGEQQVVVKPLPPYLMRFGIKEKAGIGGCTILGDGKIGLILDTADILRCLV